MRLLIGLMALAFAVAAHAAEPKETPAQPTRHAPPEYPAACTPEEGAQNARQKVTVGFDVTKEGLPENVRVLRSTDECFNDVAVAAVRGWLYEPRRIKKRPQPQTDLQVTFTFVFDETTQAEDFDARPIFRVPPEYPDRCQRLADEKEVVIVGFDVTTEGKPENIIVLESTNSCFNKVATDAVSKWRYRPKTISGKPVVRKGVVTQLTFALASGTPAQEELRRSVYYRFKHVQRLLDKGDYEKALSELDAIEAKYGDTFTPVELSAFLRLRAGARIQAKNYAGALDDLRVVQRVGADAKMDETIGKTILQLEAAVAAHDATDEGTSEEKEDQPPAEDQDGETAQQ